MLTQIKQAFNSGRSMGEHGQQGLTAVMVTAAIGVVLLVIVSTIYDGLNKDFLIGGAKSIADLTILVLAAVLVIGLLVGGFAFAVRR
ncbi:hypothetical protein LCGC14_0464650 [marine sediment metagenome]|uniref:Uncharacterized protein n=1 Tax=marine sediment metagenome TaxID=412755 RepID=A0A0F9VMT7_9ZZZZ